MIKQKSCDSLQNLPDTHVQKIVRIIHTLIEAFGEEDLDWVFLELSMSDLGEILSPASLLLQ